MIHWHQHGENYRLFVAFDVAQVWGENAFDKHTPLGCASPSWHQPSGSAPNLPLFHGMTSSCLFLLTAQDMDVERKEEPSRRMENKTKLAAYEVLYQQTKVAK